MYGGFGVGGRSEDDRFIFAYLIQSIDGCVFIRGGRSWHFLAIALEWYFAAAAAFFYSTYEL